MRVVILIVNSVKQTLNWIPYLEDACVQMAYMVMQQIASYVTLSV